MARRVRRLACLTATVGLLAAACSGSPSPVDRAGGTPSVAHTDESASPDDVHLGLVGVPSLDPAALSPASVHDVLVADLLYDTLTELDDAGRVLPGLATFAANTDRTVWRFEIDAEARFADDSPITAADAVFSLDRIRQLGVNSLPGLQLERIESLHAVGARVLEIRLRRPWTVLPEVLASPMFGIVDPGQVELARAGGDPTPNGSAGYRATVVSDRLVRLERVDAVGPARISLHLFDDSAGAHDAFVDGLVDWAPVPPVEVGPSLDVHGLRGVVPFHGSIVLGMNVDVGPLDSTDVRRAVGLALDRERLVETVFGHGAIAPNGLVPIGVPGASPVCLVPCGPERDTARAIVRDVSGGGRLSMRLLVDDSETHAALAGVLVEQLETVGIDVSVSAVDPFTYDQLVAGGQQQLFLFSTLGVARIPAVHLANLYASGSPDNVTGYGSELVDAAIAAAEADPIAAGRAARWREVEIAVLAQAPVIPLAQLTTVAVLSTQMLAFPLRVDGSVDVSRIDKADPTPE